MSTAVDVRSCAVLGSFPMLVEVPLIRNFQAFDAFRIDTRDTAKIKLSSRGKEFERLYLPKIETETVRGETLLVNTINRDRCTDPVIVAALGGIARAEITLGQFFSVFAKQPKGESGPLLVDGRANIGYVRDIEGTLGALRGCFDGTGWSFGRFTFGDARGWRANCCVISR